MILDFPLIRKRKSKIIYEWRGYAYVAPLEVRDAGLVAVRAVWMPGAGRVVRAGAATRSGRTTRSGRVGWAGRVICGGITLGGTVPRTGLGPRAGVRGAGEDLGLDALQSLFEDAA
jgi:hypothetical protein